MLFHLTLSHNKHKKKRPICNGLPNSGVPASVVPFTVSSLVSGDGADDVANFLEW